MGQRLRGLFKQLFIFVLGMSRCHCCNCCGFSNDVKSVRQVEGFSGIDPDIEDGARVDGASEWKIFLIYFNSFGFKGLISASILSIARALGEFGAPL